MAASEPLSTKSSAAWGLVDPRAEFFDLVLERELALLGFVDFERICGGSALEFYDLAVGFGVLGAEGSDV
jgi:hypothetical protein